MKEKKPSWRIHFCKKRPTYDCCIFKIDTLSTDRCQAKPIVKLKSVVFIEKYQRKIIFYKKTGVFEKENIMSVVLKILVEDDQIKYTKQKEE